MRLTEKDIIQKLMESQELYKPLIIKELKTDIAIGQRYRADALAEISIEDGPSFRALIEITNMGSPKTLIEKSMILNQYIQSSGRTDLVPIIAAPYIGKKQAIVLIENKVCYLDLCGNMLIKMPGKIYLEKTGNKNIFPDTSPIKNIFMGTSSLVSRALLLRPEGFVSQYELVDFINNRNASITAATVSKVLGTLEEDLLVNRTNKLIKTINPEQLLDRLAEGYKISTTKIMKNKFRFAVEKTEKLFYVLFEKQIDALACGFYAAKLKGLAETKEITIYIKDIENVKRAAEYRAIDIRADSEFGQVILIETKDSSLWFNSSPSQPYIPAIVDDIELYLELMADTPRGPKVASRLKNRILKKENNGR